MTPRNRVIDALVSAVLTRPRLLRAMSLPLAAGIRPMALAPRVSLADLRARPPRYTPARGELKQSAALLEGCVQSVYFGRVNAAAVTTLAADGCECVVPQGQGCCGALALHSGRESEARRRAEEMVESVRRLRAGGGDGGRVRVCHEGLRRASGYPGGAALLGGGARRQRVTGRAGPAGGTRSPTSHSGRLPGRLPPQSRSGRRGRAACAAGGDPGSGAGRDRAAGYVLRLGRRCTTSPSRRRRRSLALRKARSIIAAEPDVIATANPGCALQLAASLRQLGHGHIPIVHPTELLADAVG